MANAAHLCFVDTDCLLKLTASDLWNATLAMLEVVEEDVRINVEPHYKLKQFKDDFTQSLSATGYRRACSITNRLRIVDDAPDINEQTLLLNLHGMDQGEAALICGTHSVASFVLISADRNWPKALASQSHLHAVRERLTGNCLCFEQIILQLILQKDPPEYLEILQKLCHIQDCMNTLACVFEDGLKTPKRVAIGNLRNRIQELRNVSGDFLRQE